MAKMARFDRDRTARDALESVRAQVAALSGRSAADRPAGRVYEDEPIVRLGARDLPRGSGGHGRAGGIGAAGGGQGGPRGASAGARATAPDAVPAPAAGSAATGGGRDGGARPGALAADGWARRMTAVPGAPAAPVRVGPPPARAGRVELPSSYARVRDVAGASGPGSRLSPKVFYEQARILRDATDDFDEVWPLSSYIPCYQQMSDGQLRWYVSWRTRVRRGEGPGMRAVTSPALVRLLANEVICGFGPEPGMPAFRALGDLRRDFGGIDYSLDLCLSRWANDYVICHGLDVGLLTRRSAPCAAPPLGTIARAQVAHLSARAGSPRPAGAARGARRGAGARGDAPDGAPFERMLRAGEPPLESFDEGFSLRDAATVGAPGVGQGGPSGPSAPTRDELFDALLDACGPSARKSPFFREHRDDAAAVACAVFYRLVDHCDRRRKKGYYQGLFGSPWSTSHRMFEGAVYREEPGPDAIVHLGGAEYFARVDGAWYHAVTFVSQDGSTELTRTMRAVDARMREAYDYPRRLQERPVPKYLDRIIGEEVGRVRAWRSAHTIPELRIDRSALGGIRSAAARTRESLLVDEEREDVEEGLASSPGTLWSAARQAPAQTTLPAPAQARGEGRAGAPREVGATPSPGVPETRAQGAAGGSAGLDADEIALVRALLEGRDPRDLCRAGSVPTLDMLVDAVNERLFDALGDNAIEYVGDAPSLVEDYVDDVRSALGL
ncbi:MAG: TerB N-terminal domain-containing protein [Coriobacteriales bacterium]|jgi:hypothetical protein